jgi:L-lactate utilization protein LutC
VAEFHKLIANVRDALERRAVPTHNGAAESAKAVPTYKAARRVELASQFARELEAVGGHYLGTVTPKEMVARVRGVAAALNAQSVAVGTGLVIDPAPMMEALKLAGITVFRTAAVDDDAGRAELRGKLARCDFAVVEADCAIAATGTLRPNPAGPRRRDFHDRLRDHRQPSSGSNHRAQPHRRHRKAHRARSSRPARYLRRGSMARR